MKRYLLSASVLAVGLSALASAAQARDWSKFDFSVSLGAGFVPDYEGSDDYGGTAFPMFDLNWADTVTINMDGLKVNAISVENGKSAFSAGPLLTYNMGRGEDDNDALRGLGDIDPSIEVGGFVNYNYGPWQMDMSVRTDVNSAHKGTLADLSAGYGWEFEKGVSMATGVSTVWASDDYMQSYFGISTRQAARSAYSEYDAGAGFKNAGLWYEVSYDFDENWSIGAQSRLTQLLGDAADSPIVEDEGSATQFMTGIGVSYKF